MTFNLKKRKQSSKDYSSHKTHKLGAMQIPDEFSFITRILTQDQQDCTAFQAVAVRESELPPSVFDPMAFWNDELSFAGVKTSNGFDIEVPAAVGVKVGFCPNGNQGRQNRASAYFWITPHDGLDWFESIISLMWAQQRPVSGGMEWYEEYTANPIIARIGTTPNGGHAIKIAGKKIIAGIPYLVLQNSWGEGVGDKGLFYLSREMANKVFAPFGVYYWSDTEDPNIKRLGFITALYQNIVTLIKSFLHPLGAESRSPKWESFKKEFAKTHPAICAICGGKKGINLHHLYVFHAFPEYELCEWNVRWLCNKNRCHLDIGHLGNFQSVNPTGASDIDLWHKKRQERPMTVEEIKKVMPPPNE